MSKPQEVLNNTIYDLHKKIARLAGEIAELEEVLKRDDHEVLAVNKHIVVAARRLGLERDMVVLKEEFANSLKVLNHILH